MITIKRKLIKTSGIKFILFDGKKKIGRAYLYLIKNDLHKKPYGLLEDIYVDEKYRGKGIGTMFLNDVIKKAESLECYKLIATSRFERKNIHKWYLKSGFKKYGYEFRVNL